MKQIFSLFVALMFLLSFPMAIAQDAANETGAGSDADTIDVTAEEAADAVEAAGDSEETSADKAEEAEDANEAMTEAEVEAEVQDELESAEAGEIGNATQEDIKIMTDVKGVEVRLTQLQERIEKNIAHGEEIIAEVSSEGKDTAGLQSILEQLKSLKDKVAALETTGTVSEVTAQFVALKKEAITLTNKFKTEARKLVKADKVAALKERMKKKEAEKLADINAKVLEAKRKYNAEVFASIAASMGQILTETAARVQSGDITVKDAKAAIKKEFAKLPEQKKAQAKLKLKEKVSKEKVKRIEISQELKTKGLEKALEKVEARARIKNNSGLATAREKISANIAKQKQQTDNTAVEDSANAENEITGSAVADTGACSDTDGGKNIAVKGTMTGLFDDGYKSKSDYCTEDGGELDGKLLEFYCTTDGKATVADVVECANGCENGACVEETEAQDQECTDTDNGKDYNVKGATSTELGSFTDFCVSPQLLVENYCDYAYYPRYQGRADTYNCTNGCEEGACKPGSN